MNRLMDRFWPSRSACGRDRRSGGRGSDAPTWLPIFLPVLLHRSPGGECRNGASRAGSEQAPGAAARTGASSTGMPFSTALPEGTSTAISSASRLLLAPGCAAATSSCASGSSWPQPCGMLTTPGMIASVTSTGTSTAAALRRHAARGRRPRGRAARRRRDARASCSGPCPRTRLRHVVHPGVVGAQLAPPDQHDAAVAVPRERGPQPVDVGDDRLRRELDLPARACAAPRGCAARAGRSRCRAARPRAAPASARRDPRRSGRRTGPTRSIQSSTRSGPRARLERRDQLLRRRGRRAAMPGPAARARRAVRSRGRRTRRGRRRGPGRRRSRPAAAASATPASGESSSSSTAGE